MLFGILIAMVIAPFLGVPVLVALVAGAVLQALAAYSVTRNPMCMMQLLALVMIGSATWIFLPMIAQVSPDLKSLADTVNSISAWALGISALLSIVYSTFVGLFNISGPSAANVAK